MVFEDQRYNQLPVGPGYGKISDLPQRESLKASVPRVVHQSTLNNAVAWATLWYGYGGLHARLLNIRGESILSLPLAPAFIYRKVQKAAGCSRPISALDALEELTVNGAPRFSHFREFCVDSTSLSSVDAASKQRLGGYIRLFNTYDPQEIKISSVKQAVLLGSPVVIGMICPPSFVLASDFWQPREPAPLMEHGGHMITVVGYDDGLYGGAFEVVNSWGKTWGKDGFTWIRYEDFARHVKYGFRLIAVTGVKATVDFLSDQQQYMPVRGDGRGNYEFGRNYRTGEKFSIRITSESPAFASVVAVDPNGEKSVLFPSQNGMAPVVDTKIELPGAGYYPLTEPAGKNLLVVVLATSRASFDRAVEAVTKEAAERWVRPDGMWQPDRIKVVSNADLAVIRVVLNQVR
jgi:hypothetical protein